jgi:hypothetical protein
VLRSLIALVPDRSSGVEVCRYVDPPGPSPNVIDRLEPLAPSAFRVCLRQVCQRDECGNRLAGALDDETLSGGGLVEKLAEVLPNVERRHGSHSAIISL